MRFHIPRFLSSWIREQQREKEMLAILESYRTGLLKPKNWLSNIIAGLIVGVVALPLAMAFAIASGVKPEQGLYTAIIAGLCVALFGGTRTQIAGPTGAFVVILASITAHYGVDGLQIATLMAGVLLLMMGLLKLGNVIKFIPEPVIVGFTAGIGFIIFFGEWKDFFGLHVSLPLDASFHQKFAALIKILPNLSVSTTALALLSLVIILTTSKFLKKVPGSLMALVVVTLLQAFFQFKGVATLGSTFGSLPSSLPSLQLPDLSFAKVVNLIGPAITIALLGAIESLLSAQVADGLTGTRHRSNQELIGQGIANIFAPLFGGFAATGAIARTATNVRSGGSSPLAAIIHCIFLILVILLLAPLTSFIPLCVLAAILFVVAYKMSDVSHFLFIMKKAPWYDVLVLIATFVLTIFTDLVIAVNAGVILAMILFICRMHQVVTVEQLTSKEYAKELPASCVACPDTFIYQIQGPFFFGAADKIENALALKDEMPKKIIFRFKDVPFIDMTGLQKFQSLLEQHHKQGVAVAICEANATVAKKLLRTHVLKNVAGNRLFPSLEEAFLAPIP